MQDKLKNIINMIRENKGMEPLEILKLGYSLRDEIGFDSFDLAELTVRCEAEFDIDIFEDDIVETVGEVLDRLNG